MRYTLHFVSFFPFTYRQYKHFTIWWLRRKSLHANQIICIWVKETKSKLHAVFPTENSISFIDNKFYQNISSSDSPISNSFFCDYDLFIFITDAVSSKINKSSVYIWPRSNIHHSQLRHKIFAIDDHLLPQTSGRNQWKLQVAWIESLFLRLLFCVKALEH